MYTHRKKSSYVIITIITRPKPACRMFWLKYSSSGYILGCSRHLALRLQSTHFSWLTNRPLVRVRVKLYKQADLWRKWEKTWQTDLVKGVGIQHYKQADRLRKWSFCVTHTQTLHHNIIVIIKTPPTYSTEQVCYWAFPRLQGLGLLRLLSRTLTVWTVPGEAPKCTRAPPSLHIWISRYRTFA